MTAEWLKEIAGWLLDDPDFYINCTERQATDAIRDLLALVDKQAVELGRITRMHDQAFRAGIHHQDRAEAAESRIQSLERELADRECAFQSAISEATSHRNNCITLSARAEAAEARAETAREALEKIEGMSVPDQPAAFALSRETYLMRWVAKLRGVARDALLTAPPPTAKEG